MDSHSALRVLSGLIGVLCWAGVVFIQDDEQRRFRNRLVDWWIAVTETSEGLTRKTVAMCQSLAQKSRHFVDFVFGSRLRTWRFLLGSMSMSHVVVCGLAVAYFFDEPRAPQEAIATLAWCTALWVQLVPAKSVSVSFLRWLGKAIYVGYPVYLSFVPDQETAFVGAALLFTVVGFAVDVAMVPWNRWVLRMAETSQCSPLIVCSLIVLPCALAVLLAALGWSVDAHGDAWAGWLPRDWQVMFVIAGFAIGAPAFLVIVLNIFLSAGLFVVVFALALNVVTWNAASRLLNALYERGPSRGQVAALGVLFVGLSLAKEPIAFVMKKVGLGE